MRPDIKDILQDLADGNMTQSTAVEMIKNLESSGLKLRLKESFFTDFDPGLSEVNPNMQNVMKEKNLLEPEDLYKQLIQDIKVNIAALLKLDPATLDINQPLIEYGMDSISINEFMNRIRNKYNIHISPTVLLEFKNIEEFSQYLINQYKNELILFYKDVSKNTLNLKISIKERDECVTNDNNGISYIQEKEKNYKNVLGDRLNSIIISNLNSSIEISSVGQGEPILLIGGIGSSIRIWEKQLDVLSKHNKLLLYYPPGHGNTTLKYVPLSFSSIVEQLYKALEVINIKEPIHIVGWSLGGTIAQQFSISYAEKVRSLTLISSSPANLGTSNFSQELIKELEVLKRKVEDIDSYFPYFETAASLFREPLSQVDFLGQLSSIIAPTLIIAGNKDTYIKPVNSQKIKEKIPNSKYIEIKGAGHYPFLTHPKIFNSHLLKFIEKT